MTCETDQNGPRLAIGPLNTAGQAFHWAEACRRFGGFDATSFSGSRRKARRLTGPSHQRILHHRVRPRALKSLFLDKALQNATHLIVESYATLLGDQRRDTLSMDLPWLRSRGLVVGSVFHGDDIRSPAAHLRRNPNSYFHLMTSQQNVSADQSRATRRAVAVASGLPLFVSTPDLLLDLPSATWLPLVVDLHTWRPLAPSLSRTKFRVLHMPSARMPPIKGTSYIHPVLLELHAEGVLEYIAPGPVRHEEMPALVQSVDVVIDQVLTGSYGVAAIEAMAAGRLVLGGVDPEVRALIDGDVPILDAGPSELEGLLREVCRSPERFREVAQDGIRYARHFHSGQLSAEVLRPFVASAMS